MTDYIFRSLGYSDNPIKEDIIFTEGFCNPSSKRSRAFELLFEAYGTNKVMALSEPLVSLYEHQAKQDTVENLSVKTGMLISVGNKYCLVIPIIDSKVDFSQARRVNVGVSDCFNLMSKSIVLKYEYLGTKMNYATLKVTFYNQTIFDKFSYAALDYDAQLTYIKHGLSGFNHSSYVHPYIQSRDDEIVKCVSSYAREPTFLEFYESELEKMLYEEEMQKRKKMRQEQAARIREAMSQKREEKKSQQRAELSRLEGILNLREVDAEQFKQELQFMDMENPKELEKQIKKLKVKLGLISKEELVAEYYLGK